MSALPQFRRDSSNISIDGKAWSWFEGRTVYLHRDHALLRHSGEPNTAWRTLRAQGVSGVAVDPVAGYRLAVAAAHPGAPVHAAFLTGQGRLVPVE